MDEVLYNWSSMWIILVYERREAFAGRTVEDSFAHMMSSNHEVEAKLSMADVYLCFHRDRLERDPTRSRFDFEAVPMFSSERTFAQAKALESVSIIRRISGNPCSGIVLYRDGITTRSRAETAISALP
jgi:hypothetical protein